MKSVDQDAIELLASFHQARQGQVIVFLDQPVMRKNFRHGMDASGLVPSRAGQRLVWIDGSQATIPRTQRVSHDNGACSVGHADFKHIGWMVGADQLGEFLQFDGAHSISDKRIGGSVAFWENFLNNGRADAHGASRL